MALHSKLFGDNSSGGASGSRAPRTAALARWREMALLGCSKTDRFTHRAGSPQFRIPH